MTKWYQVLAIIFIPENCVYRTQQEPLPSCKKSARRQRRKMLREIRAPPYIFIRILGVHDTYVNVIFLCIQIQ